MTGCLERELGGGRDLLTSALARAAALERAARVSRGVSVPIRIRRRPDGVVAFDVPVVPGQSLAEVVAGRALSVGECVTVGVGVAEALAAMHAERVAHGDVSPANVIVRGRNVTLVDTMGALRDERGTPGFAAPERAEGATPAGDVYALGALLRGLAGPDGIAVIEAWTAPLVAEDPAQRPGAAHAARAIARCAPADPVRSSAAAVATAMRAGAVPRTVATKEDRWWRAERAAIRLSPFAALAAVAVVAACGLVPAMAAAPSGPPVPSTLPVSAAVLASPQAAAEELTRRRVDALAEGDGVALGALARPGSEAGKATPAEVEMLDGLELLGVAAALESASPGRAVVRVTSTLSGYGVGRHSVPAATVSARLELTLTSTGWLVERILPPP